MLIKRPKLNTTIPLQFNGERQRMSSTVFIAVQCCQCSTMQVKQKKKSSNKWTCVVCNQKQSLRKIFAQGCTAKDIRKFVQSFNMSRKFADDDGGQLESLTPTASLSDAEDRRRKRRSNWDEYLDPSDDNVQQGDLEEGDDFGPKIVTELPKELLKKPKLRNYASGSHTGNGEDNSYKPVFSKRNANHHVLSQSQGREGKKHQAEKAIDPRKWSDFMTRDTKEPRPAQPAIALKGSKWDPYMTNDDYDTKMRNGRNFGDDMGLLNHDMWETMVHDQKVEDDIHPDFM